MTVAGMGISYLPVRSYENEIAQKRLAIVHVTNALEPVEFIAACPVGQTYSLARAVAELACEVSDFTRNT